MSAPLFLFVWRGDGVLHNYGSGLVVVVADSVDSAWAKLRSEQLGVYTNLYYRGPSYLEAESELEWWLQKQKENGDPLPCSVATTIERHPSMLTAAELAVLLGTSPKTIYAWVKAGTLPACNHGRVHPFRSV